jgi:hypothetical protein
MIGWISYFLFPGASPLLDFLQGSLVVTGFFLSIAVCIFMAIADRGDEIDTRTPEGKLYFDIYTKTVTNKWALAAVLFGILGYLGFIPVYFIFKRKK